MTLTLIYIVASVIVTLIVGAAIRIGGSGNENESGSFSRPAVDARSLR